MKRMVLVVLAIMLMLSFNGCSDGKNLDGLISKFKENKIDGKFYTNAFAMIGAVNGGRYTNSNSGVNMEIYEWKDSSDVKMAPYKNGRFGMILHTPRKSTAQHKKIVAIFEDF